MHFSLPLSLSTVYHQRCSPHNRATITYFWPLLWWETVACCWRINHQTPGPMRLALEYPCLNHCLSSALQSSPPYHDHLLLATSLMRDSRLLLADQSSDTWPDAVGARVSLSESLFIISVAVLTTMPRSLTSGHFSDEKQSPDDEGIGGGPVDVAEVTHQEEFWVRFQLLLEEVWHRAGQGAPGGDHGHLVPVEATADVNEQLACLGKREWVWPRFRNYIAEFIGQGSSRLFCW